MSLSLDLKRIFREGLIAFWRNKLVSFASLLVMIISLFVLSSIVFMNSVTDFTLSQLEDRIDVNIYFFPSAPESEILELQNKIALIPEVETVNYVSREEALFAFQNRHQSDELIIRSLDEVADNPLGASLNIQAQTSSQYEAIIAHIESDPAMSDAGFVERINYRDNEAIIQRLNHFGTVMRAIVYSATLFFVIIAILVVLSTMRIAIFANKKEIHVKRLVGAEHRYIRGPFMVMGLLYGFIAGIITMISLYPITSWLGAYTKTFFGGMDIAQFYQTNLLAIAIIIIGFGILLGIVSSLIAIRKYLRI